MNAQNNFVRSPCPSCGTAVWIASGGTGFCAKCGSHAALVPPPAEGWDVERRAIGGQGPPEMPSHLVAVPEPERSLESYIVESRRGTPVAGQSVATSHTAGSWILAIAITGVVAVTGVLVIALV